MRMGYIISTAFGPNDVTHFVLAPELISSLIWTTEAYVPATIVNVPMSTKMTLTTVRIHQLRVLWFRHVTCRYMRASVILGRQLVDVEVPKKTYMQRKEPRRAPMTESRSSKIGIDSAMINDIKQLKATQPLSKSAILELQALGTYNQTM